MSFIEKLIGLSAVVKPQENQETDLPKENEDKKTSLFEDAVEGAIEGGAFGTVKAGQNFKELLDRATEGGAFGIVKAGQDKGSSIKDFFKALLGITTVVKPENDENIN